MKVTPRAVRQSYVSPLIFGVSLLVLMMLGGIHTGLIVVLFQFWSLGSAWTSIIIIAYWVIVSLAFTIVTHWQLEKFYQEPVRKIAKSVSQVAQGDFSVYLPPRHTPDRYDYLDRLMQDFNKMVEALGSIETLKTDFLSNVSHEIKTPLTVIQNTAELLQDEFMTPDERQRHVQAIIQASQRLSGLITNMLKLNKLEKQTILPQPEPYDLCAQLCDCALQFERQWEEKNIEFEAELEDRAMIWADSSLMEIVWNNLLANAIKFTSPGGRVMLRQYSATDAVVVQVIDSGCGMREDIIPHIFEKFYQGDSSHATEGNGLGLALVRQVLQWMDGNIQVESTWGKGSVFTVTLPRKTEMEGERLHHEYDG